MTKKTTTGMSTLLLALAMIFASSAYGQEVSTLNVNLYVGSQGACQYEVVLDWNAKMPSPYAFMFPEVVMEDPSGQQTILAYNEMSGVRPNAKHVQAIVLIPGLTYKFYLYAQFALPPAYAIAPLELAKVVVKTQPLPCDPYAPYLNGAANAASYEGTTKIVQDNLLVIFGHNMYPFPASSIDKGDLPTSYFGVQVLLNGYGPIPIKYISENYIVVAAPDQLFSFIKQKITVSVPGLDGKTRVSNELELDVANIQLGIYKDIQGKVLVYDQWGRLNSVSIPLLPAYGGIRFTFFASGLGPIDVPPPTGKAAPTTPLASLRLDVVRDVYFDNSLVPNAQVTAFLVPGYVGRWQVDVFVPDSNYQRVLASHSVEVRFRFLGDPPASTGVFSIFADTRF